jgi:hypothetical protein
LIEDARNRRERIIGRVAFAQSSSLRNGSAAAGSASLQSIFALE